MPHDRYDLEALKVAVELLRGRNAADMAIRSVNNGSHFVPLHRIDATIAALVTELGNGYRE